MLQVVLAVPALSLVPSFTRPAATLSHAPRRAVDITCVATTDEEKALLAASQQVTIVAKKFGPTQGKAAQTWVEEAIKEGSASTDELMQMQLQLFSECKLDDESGRCKDLSDAIEVLTAAVAERKAKPRTDEFDFKFATGATPIQEAATKLRSTATLFGPEQRQAADAWIKKITSGEVSDGTGLLEEQVALFGECVLSEDGTPSNCQQLEQALSELQLAIETCNVDAPQDCSADEVAGALQDEQQAAGASAKPTGGKRKAIMRFVRKVTGASKLSPLTVASFLASPGEVSAELGGLSRDELVARLEEEGVDSKVITHAITSVLPYLPGQEAPGVPSQEAP